MDEEFEDCVAPSMLEVPVDTEANSSDSDGHELLPQAVDIGKVESYGLHWAKNRIRSAKLATAIQKPLFREDWKVQIIMLHIAQFFYRRTQVVTLTGGEKKPVRLRGMKMTKILMISSTNLIMKMKKTNNVTIFVIYFAFLDFSKYFYKCAENYTSFLFNLRQSF